MKFFYIDSLGLINLININSNFFNFNFISYLVYRFINFYSFNSRLNCSVQKNRSLVNFSTKKLYRQKGTGKARAGSASSPIRRKGGRAFPGFSYENYKCKINKNLFKYSLIMIFNQYFIQNSIFIIEDFFFINLNISFFFKKIFINFYFYSNIILLCYFVQKNFYISVKNLTNFNIVNIFKINPIFLLKFSKIFITRIALSNLYKFLH